MGRDAVKAKAMTRLPLFKRDALALAAVGHRPLCLLTGLRCTRFVYNKSVDYGTLRMPEKARTKLRSEEYTNISKEEKGN